MVNVSVTPEKTVIDSRFDIPDGLDAFYYADVPDHDATEEEVIILAEDIVVATSVDGTGTEYTPEVIVSSTAPPPPTSIAIISQSVKTSPDGRQVINVVIEVPDVSGVLNYDVRVTAA